MIHLYQIPLIIYMAIRFNTVSTNVYRRAYPLSYPLCLLMCIELILAFSITETVYIHFIGR